jgi:hypothetical protein
MPLEVRSAREIAVEKFSGLSPEEVRRATMLHLEHNAYDLRGTATLRAGRNKSDLQGGSSSCGCELGNSSK